MTKSIVKIDLNEKAIGYIGTTGYFVHTTGYNLSDGVEFLRSDHNAGWLIDDILSQNVPVPTEEFQVWKLERLFTPYGDRTESFTLSCEDGDHGLLRTKELILTEEEFSADKIELWFQNGVLFLPSEY